MARNGPCRDRRRCRGSHPVLGEALFVRFLLAAAHASSFLMNLALGLQAAGYSPRELSAEAVVTLEPDGPGVRIGCSALRLRAKVPGLARRAFEALAWHAERTCPVSKALNAQVTLDARLTGECPA